MKRFLVVSLLIACAAFSACAPVFADNATNVNPAASGAPAVAQTPGQFLQGVEGWFTNPDTNLTCATKFSAWTSADYASGVNFADSVGVRYHFTPVFSLEEITQNAGIAGVIVSEAAGVGVSLNHYSVQVTAGVDGGERLDVHKAELMLYLEVRKATTANTFLGGRIGYEKVFGLPAGNVPQVSVEIGVMF